jgi:hypothetical protein
MVCFKNWLVLEGLRDSYKSCVRDVLIERTCLETLKILIEMESDEESEEFSGDLDAEKFPDDPNAKPIEDLKSQEPEQTQTAEEEQTIREMLKELKNAILVLRWNAVAKRARQIEEIKSLRDQYVENFGNVNENTEDEDEDDDLEFLQAMSSGVEVKKKNFLMNSVAPLLKKLGYVDADALREEGNSDEEILNSLTQALFKAAEEKGNDLPVGVEDKINPESEKHATDTFFLKIRDVFRRSFNKIVRNQIQYVVSPSDIKKTGTLYDPGYFDRGEISSREYQDQTINDIANRFAVKMYEVFTKREISSSTGNPESWLVLRNYKNFGKIGANELEDEEFVEALMNYIRSHLKRFSSNEEREAKLANSPSRPSQDLDVWGGNRDKKANLINKDIESNNLDFYKKYMTASDQERTKMDDRLVELKLKLKDKKLRMPAEERKKLDEEKWRLEMLQQIVFLRSKHSESLSEDPSKIVNTLRYFRSNFLGHKYRTQSFFGAMGKRTDDGSSQSDLLGFGTDATARAGAGGSREKGTSSEPNPASAVAGNQIKSILHEKLIDAFNYLRNQGATERSTGIKTGQKMALSLCSLWGLSDEDRPCNLSSIPNISAFSGLIDTTKETKPNSLSKLASSSAPPCAELLFNLRAPGKTKSLDKVAEEVNSLLGQNNSTTTVRKWINDGIQIMCDYLSRQLKPIQSSLLPAPEIPTRKFDSSRPSPLASRIQSRTKVVMDPETGKKTWQTENQDS